MSFISTGSECNQAPGFGNLSQQKLANSDVGSSKLKKLVAESVEVSITLCHQNLNAVGHTKLADIVNQIIPTGWVLSTGYWPYYANQQGHCLCVCSRFAIPCRHVRSHDHWLDLSSTTDFLPDVTAVSLPVNAVLTVTNFECIVTAMGYELYNVNTRFQLLISEGGKLTGRKQMWIEGNYKLSVERYASIEVCIMFHPSPQSMPSYGRILNEVLVNSGVQDTFVTYNSSKQTFIAFPTNTQHSFTTIAFPMLQTTVPIKNKAFDAFTQTEQLNDAASSQHFQDFSLCSNSLFSPELSFQTLSASPSFYSQLPPPYPLSQSTNEEMLNYRERRGRRGYRASGNSTGESYGNLPLSMFLSEETFNQPQPQAFRGRKQKKAVRRIKMEPKVDNTNMEAVQDDLVGRMDANLNLIDDLFP